MDNGPSDSVVYRTCRQALTCRPSAARSQTFAARTWPVQKRGAAHGSGDLARHRRRVASTAKGSRASLRLRYQYARAPATGVPAARDAQEPGRTGPPVVRIPHARRIREAGVLRPAPDVLTGRPINADTSCFVSTCLGVCLFTWKAVW